MASFGLDTTAGLPANIKACEVARARGITLAGFSTRTITQVQIDGNDLLVAMEPPHARALQRAFRAKGAQVTLLGLWAPSPRPAIADPYGLSDDFFVRCFELIDAALETIVAQVKGSAHLRPS